MLDFNTIKEMPAFVTEGIKQVMIQSLEVKTNKTRDGLNLCIEYRINAPSEESGRTIKDYFVIDHIKDQVKQIGLAKLASLIKLVAASVPASKREAFCRFEMVAGHYDFSRLQGRELTIEVKMKDYVGNTGEKKQMPNVVKYLPPSVQTGFIAPQARPATLEEDFIPQFSQPSFVEEKKPKSTNFWEE